VWARIGNADTEGAGVGVDGVDASRGRSDRRIQAWRRVLWRDDMVDPSPRYSEGHKRTRKIWDASDGHAGERNGDMWSSRAVMVDGGMSGSGGG
jgi:hypothetical protein